MTTKLKTIYVSSHTKFLVREAKLFPHETDDMLIFLMVKEYTKSAAFLARQKQWSEILKARESRK